eukprot:5975259-Pleurochrysis_carterae.AAC.2
MPAHAKRVDVSCLSAERVIEVLGAHTSNQSPWPMRTSVRCWTCCHAFDTIPIGLPTKMHRLTKKLHVVGVFCSFNCAKRHALDNLGSSSWEACHLLTYMHKRVVGHTSGIPPAAGRMALTEFGGVLSIDEFRKGFMVLPPTAESSATIPDFVNIIDRVCVPTFLSVHHTRRGKPLAECNKHANERGYERETPLRRSQDLITNLGGAVAGADR